MGDQDPTSPLLQSDDAFQIYLMALSDSSHSSSVMPAVRRREQLLRSLAPAIDTSQPASEQVKEASAEDQAEPQTSVSRSEEIAQQILMAGPLTRSTLLRRSKPSGAANSLRQNLLRASASGGGGPENPIYVTIAERAFSF